MFEIGRRIVSPIIFYKGGFYLFLVFIIMNLMVHNWLKRAMAGQLSMETYAKTVKDKDHQMMIIHGDKHIGKDASLVLAAENPYLHEEVQEYVYEITKPYIKKDNYSGYTVSCKEENSVDILTAMSNNPIMSKEIISKLVDDLALIFDEVKNKVPSGSWNNDVSELVSKIYSKYGEFLNNVSHKHGITKNSQSKIINIVSSTNEISRQLSYAYERQRIAGIGDNLISSLVSNRFINVNERLEMTNQYLTPEVVSSFVKSDGVGENHIAGIITGGISKTDGINEAQIDNRVKVMIALVESVNFEDDKLEKLFFSQQFFDFFKKINALREHSSYPGHRGHHEFQGYQNYILKAMSKRTKTEEARVNFFKIILSENAQSGRSSFNSIHELIGSVMNTGKISEEFVDLLFKNMDKEIAFDHLSRTCINNYHLFKYIFDKYSAKNELFGSSTVALRTNRWIRCCIDKGIDCDSQYSLFNSWLEYYKSYFDEDPSGRFSYIAQNLLFATSDTSYPLLFISSRNKKCPELIRKITSIGRGSFRNNFYNKRLSEVKLMIARGTWQKDS